MPNWIEGTLKIRGKYENIDGFMMRGLGKSSVNEKIDGFIPVEKHVENGAFSYTTYTVLPDTYVEGTRRAFVGDSYIYVESIDGSEDETFILCMPVRQAWCFEVDEWQRISKKYGVDVRLFGIECGMCYCTEIEIINGEVTRQRDFTYDDWEWECPFPHMGG